MLLLTGESRNLRQHLLDTLKGVRHRYNASGEISSMKRAKRLKHTIVLINELRAKRSLDLERCVMTVFELGIAHTAQCVERTSPYLL